MAYTISAIGPIILTQPPKGEKTSGQVRSFNSYDSRMINRVAGTLHYHRIREIRKDPTVQLARQAVVSPMIHTPWSYKSNSSVPSDAVDSLVEMMKHKRDWFLQNIVYGALDFGWSPFEVIYRPQDGMITIFNLKQLLQDYTYILVYIDTGTFAGLTNEPIMVGEVAKNVIIQVPYAANFNLAVEGTDWYGLSVSEILDPINSAWDDVNTTANRYDRKMAGATWVVYYPVGETTYNGNPTSNSVIAASILSSLEAAGSVAIPDEIQEWLDDSVEREMKGKWRVELIAASTSTQSSFIDRQKYLDTLKIRAFGIPERSLLEGVHGTKAEAAVHADWALATIDTKHRLICDQINEQIVVPWMRLNYGKKVERSVWIEPAPLVDAQFQTVKEIYRLLVQSPQIIAKEIENLDVPALRDQLGIPSAPDAPNDYTYEEPQVTPPGTTQGDMMSGVADTPPDAKKEAQQK